MIAFSKNQSKINHSSNILILSVNTILILCNEIKIINKLQINNLINKILI